MGDDENLLLTLRIRSPDRIYCVTFSCMHTSHVLVAF
jgi:hypothetical protein